MSEWYVKSFHDLAEWFVMDETDEDDDWCVVGDHDATEVIRAVQTDEHVPGTRRRIGVDDFGLRFGRQFVAV